MKFINSLTENEKFTSIYLVKTKSQGTAKTGKEFFSINLQDKTGNIEGKIWDINSSAINDFNVGDFVEINAEVNVYNNNKQLKIEKLRVCESDEYNSSDYFLTTKKDMKVLEKQLDDLINSISNAKYKKLLTNIFIKDKEFRERFLNHQGAKSVHHNFIGGLLEHTISVVNVALSIAKNYNDINVDLIITASLLHDIGKVYEIEDYPVNEYSDSGHLIGHIIIGYDIVSRTINEIGEFTEIEKNEVLHCILSHHGSLEFGSTKLPSLIEAMIVSTADNVDAKIEIMRELIDNFKLNNKSQFSFVGYNKFLDTNIRETSNTK